MTRKAVALALAVVGALTLATSAAAATLSLPTAEQLAKRVALKEIRGRNIVAFHVTHARRRGPREIDFVYDDRSRAKVYCTGRLVVRAGPSGTITARVARPACRPIPADALALEAVAARARRLVHGRRRAVDASLVELRLRLRPCATLRVPRTASAQVRLIAGAGSLEALADPVLPQVTSFVSSLLATKTSTPAFTAAEVAWSDYATALRALPPLPNPCETIRAWARRQYASPAPVDVTALARLNTSMTLAARRIGRAAKLLAADGVFPRDVVAFTPAGLLLQLKVKSLVVGAG